MFLWTAKMRFLSFNMCVSELFITLNIIVLAAAQTQLTNAERRVLEGFTGIRDGHVNVLDQRRSSDPANVPEPSVHIHLPGKHGNQLPLPVVHRHSTSASESSGVHVDLPGRHGNDSPIPVVHRTGTDTHVDHPGQHGNQSPIPVVHRENRLTFSSQGPEWRPDFSSQIGNHLPSHAIHNQDGTHVDLPGEHGNRSPHPVVHRGGGAHVDIPGQHGNNSPHPVVHRQDGTHVDLPGEKRNLSPHPVVHRGRGAHVDIPGQHGNNSPHPVVHRQDGSHVDLPGQHGNESPVPVVHRDGSNIHMHAQNGGVPQGQFSGLQSQFIDPITGSPVVLPGQNNDFDRFPQSSGDRRMSFNSGSDSIIGIPRSLNVPAIQAPTIVPVGFPFIQGAGFPGFRGPFGPGSFGPPPFLFPPEARRMRPVRRGMRRLMRPGQIFSGGLQQPFSLPLPPRRQMRIGVRGLIAGAIGSLFGRLLRQ